MPNVIVSPHSASTVAAQNSRIVDISLDNLGRFINGQPLRNTSIENAAIEPRSREVQRSRFPEISARNN